MRPSPDDAVTIVVTQHLGNWTSATVTPVLPGISDACNTCGPPQIGVQQGGSAMRIRMRFSLFMAVAALLCVGLAAPAATFAAGDPAKPAASPKPDSQKKVWTNDDVERLNPDFV